MKAPAFWTRRGIPSALLTPVAAAYRAVDYLLRARKPVYRAPVPVICIGNLTVGGTGKTPTVIEIVQHLSAENRTPHVVSRGYGGSEAGPLLVDIVRHKAAEVGDEPLLIASYVPTWIARDRAAGVRAAVAAGAGVVVLDDGFQNPSVAKDISIIVVDASYGFGNGRTLPAGPLREPVAAGMARADAVLLIGDPPESWPETLHGKPVFRARIEARKSGMSFDGVRVFAFAGIGRPEKFFDTLRGLGAQIIDSEAFDDHQTYSRTMLDRLLARADAQDLMPVTTEKDAVKLPAFTRGRIWPVPIGLVGEDLIKIKALVDDALASSSAVNASNLDDSGHDKSQS